jgi:hypothetical protein
MLNKLDVIQFVHAITTLVIRMYVRMYA